MAHKLRLLTEKLYNTPHLMEPSRFESVMAYLDERNKGTMDVSSEDQRSERVDYSYNPDTKVGMIDIDGPLTYKPVTMMGFECGGTSYEGVMSQMETLVQKGMKTLVLNVDSGGGEAYAVFETAAYIRKLADENGVKILSYVDGMSASAAYALTSISDQIVVNPGAEVGSIGVVVRLMNDSKALEMNGLERTFVYAGGSKVPYAEDGSFREDFISDIQSKVDILYEEFTGFVAEQRNVSVETVRSTEAKTFLPKKALELGLADAVMTHEEFYTHLADVAEKDTIMFKRKLFNMDTTVSEAEMKELELAQTQLSEAQVLLAAKDEKIVELQAALEALPSLQASLEEATAELAVFKAEKEAAELAAKQAVAEARKAKLVAAIGEDRAVELSATMEDLSDEKFEKILSAFTATTVVEKKSALFTEMGSDTTVETNPSMEAALEQAIAKLNKSK